MLRKLFFIICIVFYSSMSFGKTLEIEMLNKLGKEKMVYSIKVAKVDQNDKIIWKHVSKGHNVEWIAGPDGAELPKKSKNGKEVSMTFEVHGIYYYWCTPHKGMGMIGLVVVGDDVSNKDAIVKAKALGKSKKKLKALLGEL